MNKLLSDLHAVQELYRQEATEALNQRLIQLVDRALEGLRTEFARVLKDGSGDDSDIFLPLLEANAIGKDWQAFTLELWRRYEAILDRLEEVWTHAEQTAGTPPLTTQARSQLQVMRGLAPSADGVATGLAARFFHMNDQVRAQYTDALMRSVLLGQSQQSLYGELDKILQSSRRRTALVLRDANMQYAREAQYVHAASEGEQFFEFIGPRDAVTRPFCDRYEGKILHIDEISALDNGQTGKGTAMVAGGGYNCRHHWRVVRESWFSPEEWAAKRTGIDPPAEVKPTVPSGLSDNLERLFIDPDALLLPKGAEELGIDRRHFEDDTGAVIGTPWKSSDVTRILPAGSSPALLKRVIEASLGRLSRPPEVVSVGKRNAPPTSQLTLLHFSDGDTITIREWNTRSEEGQSYELTVEFGPKGRRHKLKVNR